MNSNVRTLIGAEGAPSEGYVGSTHVRKGRQYRCITSTAATATTPTATNTTTTTTTTLQPSPPPPPPPGPPLGPQPQPCRELTLPSLPTLSAMAAARPLHHG